MRTLLNILGVLTVTINVQAQQFNGGANNTTTGIYRSGQTGFGLTSTPTYIVDVEVTTSGDALRVYSNSSSGVEPAIILQNQNTGGGQWSFIANDNSSTPAGSFFQIQNTTNSTCLLIEDATGNIGIGTQAPAQRLHVLENSTSGNTSSGLFAFTANGAGTFAGITANNSSGGVTINNQINVGVSASADCDGNGSMAMGVQASAIGSSSNDDCVGGYFEGQGASANFNVGVYGIVSGNLGSLMNVGVYGDDGGIAAPVFAGYFNGDVFRTGNDNFSSDRKLKQNIMPLSGALDKILKLKPSSYTYRREEFKGMSLPAGTQMGLIAQDLEEVFPSLVTNMNGWTKKDKDGKVIGTIPDFKAVQYISLIPVLIAAVQEEHKLTEALQLQLSQQQQLLDEYAVLFGRVNGINTPNQMMDDFSLDQNIPNPASKETTINYSLPASVQAAAIGIFDLSGKQIKMFELADRKQTTLTISLNDIPDGIYLYSIIADGKVMLTKRMLVSEK